MVIKRSIGEKVFDAVNIIFILLMIILSLYPFYYVIICSLSNSALLMSAKGILLWPQGFSLAAYIAVLKNPAILSGYKITLIVLIVGTTINVIMTAFCAFLLTRKDYAFRNVLMYMTLITMYFGGGMLPIYIVIYKWLGLGNSLWALILPGAVSTYNMIIMRTNFASIPASLEESAKIDGANDIVILFRIILPLSSAIIAVMVLFYGVANWNAWFNAMLYIRDRDKYPLQLILREILILNNAQTVGNQGGGGAEVYQVAETMKYATIIVATLPILVVYPYIQKYFISGVMIGAVKG